jgi:ethanolamine utilization protein EutQ (cupin superfamily)
VVAGRYAHERQTLPGEWDMTDYDAMAPNARRYPRVITGDEITALPRLEFNTGIDTAIFLSRERDDARYFRQGYCYMEPDHQPYHWDQTNFDETHYCLEGQIRLRVRDKEGREVILEAGEGEHIYLPGGYAYTLEATGMKSVFFWSSGPSPRPGLVEAKDYSRQLTALREA